MLTISENLDKTDFINSCIKKLGNELKKCDAVISVNPIYTARIPILKIIEKTTEIPMDISFNNEEGYCCIEPILTLCQRFPNLRPLILLFLVKSYKTKSNNESII